MTIIEKDGSETEITDDSAVARAYRALQTAAERIARNNSASYQQSAAMNKLPGIRRGNKAANRGAYTITQEHEALVKAMPKVLDGSLSPEEAMAMLHDHDTLEQRF